MSRFHLTYGLIVDARITFFGLGSCLSATLGVFLTRGAAEAVLFGVSIIGLALTALGWWRTRRRCARLEQGQ